MSGPSSGEATAKSVINPDQAKYHGLQLKFAIEIDEEQKKFQKNCRAIHDKMEEDLETQLVLLQEEMNRHLMAREFLKRQQFVVELLLKGVKLPEDVTQILNADGPHKIMPQSTPAMIVDDPCTNEDDKLVDLASTIDPRASPETLQKIEESLKRSSSKKHSTEHSLEERIALGVLMSLKDRKDKPEKVEVAKQTKKELNDYGDKHMVDLPRRTITIVPPQPPVTMPPLDPPQDGPPRVALAPYPFVFAHPPMMAHHPPQPFVVQNYHHPANIIQQVQHQPPFAHPLHIKLQPPPPPPQPPHLSTQALHFSTSTSQSTTVHTSPRSVIPAKPKKQYKCNVCGKMLSTPHTLKAHMHQHNGDWPYKCQFCDKGFNTPADMKKHLRTHTGFKPFECETCGKKCADKSNLTKHVRTHQKVEK